ESTCMFPRSPPWRTGVLTPPWCAAAFGLKCGPALVASGALQSPLSCTCTPCSPGLAPCTSTITTTPEAAGVMRAFPVTVLLLRDAGLAVPPAGVAAGAGAAVAGAGAAAGAAAGAGVGDGDEEAQATARIMGNAEIRITRTSAKRGREPSRSAAVV